VTSVIFVIMTFATISLGRGLLEHRLYRVFGEPSDSSIEDTRAGYRVQHRPNQTHHYRMPI
jgi:hypothetical protein